MPELFSCTQLNNYSTIIESYIGNDNIKRMVDILDDCRPYRISTQAPDGDMEIKAHMEDLNSTGLIRDWVPLFFNKIVWFCNVDCCFKRIKSLHPISKRVVRFFECKICKAKFKNRKNVYEHFINSECNATCIYVNEKTKIEVFCPLPPFN